MFAGRKNRGSKGSLFLRGKKALLRVFALQLYLVRWNLLLMITDYDI